jgi:hypothetical protein
LRVGIHDQLANFLVIGEDMGVLEHGVDQGRFAVVNVGDYSYIAQVILGLEGHRFSWSAEGAPLGRRATPSIASA